MSFAATSKSAACGGRALLLLAAAIAAVGALLWGAGGARAASLALCTTTTSTPTASPSSATAGTTITYTATVTASAGCANGFPTGKVAFYSNFVSNGQQTSYQVGESATLQPTATAGTSIATLTDNSLPTGSFVITASYTSSDESLFYDSSSANGANVVISSANVGATTMSFSATPTTVTVGQSIDFHVQITSTTGTAPTGNVDFSAGPTGGSGQFQFASYELNDSGIVDFTYNGLAAGDYVVVASYPGDAGNSGSSGQLLIHVVAASSPVATSTTVTANPASITAGQQTTLSAHVVETGGAAPPTGGEVDFYAGTNPTSLTEVGSGQTDSSGNASVTLTNFSSGTYTVRAQYAGSSASNVQGSYGDSTLFVATASGSGTGGSNATTTQYAGVTSGAYGSRMTLTGELENGNGAPLSAEVLTLTLGTQSCTTPTTTGSGLASCTITLSQPPGQYSVTASFAGDSTWAPSTGSSTVTITQAATSIAYTGATSGVYGTTATLSATLTANGSGLAGETLNLAMDGKSCTTGPTDSTGSASCTVPVSQTPASYPITASFGGDANYTGSSTTGTFVVGKSATTTTYTGATTALQGTTATLSAQVAGAPDGEPVTFAVGAETCTGTLSGGTASCQVTVTDAAGTNYTVSATYAGDTNLAGSSASHAFTVTAAAATTTHIAPVAPVSAGSHVTLTATVSPAAATGSVTFASGATTLCTATLSGGAASCSATFASAGTYTVTATYGGNGSYAPSSDSTTVTVSSAKPTTLTYTGPTSGTTDSPVTLSATLTDAAGHPVANETVTLALGSQSCTDKTDWRGDASCTITISQRAGTYRVTATFAGDSAYGASSDSDSFVVGSTQHGGNGGKGSTCHGNFNGGSVDRGGDLWFNSHLKVRGIPRSGATITFRGQTITVGGRTLSVPDAEIVFSRSARTTTTSFVDGKWVTTVPVDDDDGDVFLSSLDFHLPSGLGGRQDVSWSGTFACDSPGVTVSWQWGASASRGGPDYAGSASDPSSLNF
jgi:Bacterial Ig-like domain (group 3)